jgi:hypothetical protein
MVTEAIGCAREADATGEVLVHGARHRAARLEDQLPETITSLPAAARIQA